MRIRLAFTALAVVLAVAGCEHPEDTSPSPSPGVGALPECELEDGSTQRECVWHADRSGNGSGLSFYSYDFGSRVVYFEPADYVREG